MDEQIFQLILKDIQELKADVKLLLAEKNKGDGKQLIISSLISVVLSVGIGILIAKVGK